MAAAILSRTVLAAALSVSHAAAAAAAFTPCHLPYTPFTRAVESPCFTSEGALGSGVDVRSYAPTVDNGATLVSANETAKLQPWADALEVTANHMFDYFEGDGNAGGINLTEYVTAPLMFRPATKSRLWFADMVLAPSAWPAKSKKPQPARGFVTLSPFGPLTVAVLHRVIKAPPAQADFEACDATLRKVVSGSSAWAVNAEGKHTPTFAFYFPRDDETPLPGPYDIECWVEVTPK